MTSTLLSLGCVPDSLACCVGDCQTQVCSAECEGSGHLPSPMGSPGLFLQHTDQRLLVFDCFIVCLCHTAAYKDLKKGSESVCPMGLLPIRTPLAPHHTERILCKILGPG